jgi:hypothetical protein
MTHSGYRVILFCIAILLLGRATLGQHMSQGSKVLVPSNIHDSTVPPFTSEAHPQCDKAGSLYFHLWTSNGSLANILRLSPDATEGKLFGVPDEYARKGQIAFNDFSVTPDGKVEMFVGVGEKAYIFRFDGDGQFDKAIPVDLSMGLLVSNIIAFDSGATLLLGHFTAAAPPKLKGKSYLAALDPSGGLNVVEPSPLPEVDLDQEDLSPGAFSAEDGNAYFLYGDYVWAMSQTGEVVRRIHIEKPDPKDLAVNVRVSGNWAIVDLATRTLSESPKGAANDQPGGNFFRFLLIDAIGGEAIGLYELPSEFKGLEEVCFSRKEGLKFMRPQKKKFLFFTAAL